jgi:hypothetical protein
VNPLPHHHHDDVGSGLIGPRLSLLAYHHTYGPAVWGGVAQGAGSGA